MNIETVDFPWEFDVHRLHDDMKLWCQRANMPMYEMLELLGLSPTWGFPRAGYVGPTVSNLLMVCNALDLDPRDYFVLRLP